jgi:2-methylcitrate dehydratase PrpD
VSGKALLEAVIAGYEVGARLGAATQFRDGIHPHGTWGACGGAVAVGRLTGLDRGQLSAAIRIASALAVATNYQVVRDGATARNLWSGMGNLVAIVAAQSVQAGFSGPFDGPANIYGETLGKSFDRHVASAGLGSDWYLGRNYFKLYACCRHAHASIDALRLIVDGLSLSPDKIERIEVHTYGRAAAARLSFRFPIFFQFISKQDRSDAKYLSRLILTILTFLI